MSYLDVYIGDPEDSTFNWDDGDWNGNIPKKVGPYFPPTAPFHKLLEEIKSGKLFGKQADFGGYVAIVTKKQLKQFFDESYSEDDLKFLKSLKHLSKKYLLCKSYIEQLDPTKKYLLVACEL